MASRRRIISRFCKLGSRVRFASVERSGPSAQSDLTRRVISRFCQLSRRVRLSSTKMLRLLSVGPLCEVSRPLVCKWARGDDSWNRRSRRCTLSLAEGIRLHTTSHGAPTNGSSRILVKMAEAPTSRGASSRVLASWAVVCGEERPEETAPSAPVRPHAALHLAIVQVGPPFGTLYLAS